MFFWMKLDSVVDKGLLNIASSTFKYSTYGPKSRAKLVHFVIPYSQNSIYFWNPVLMSDCFQTAFLAFS